MEQEKHNSLYIAPLSIHKGAIRLPTGHPDTLETVKEGPEEPQESRGPETIPDGYVEGTDAEEEEVQLELAPTFHSYLRAFYDFRPASNADTSTVTLPISQGDIVLIHSVHTNGWADGTLLSTGARGWLPTNYCQTYGNEITRPLLSALTSFWDLARGTSSVQDLFASQDHVRGLVAGARCVLVRIGIILTSRHCWLIRAFRNEQVASARIHQTSGRTMAFGGIVGLF